ncbi:hypothetical protein HYW46_04315 [Candidatus Daviesbacteria bacterium]|nr:hypothetical protein [Candidatus Daviesbacteria bacterium]
MSCENLDLKRLTGEELFHLMDHHQDGIWLATEEMLQHCKSSGDIMRELEERNLFAKYLDQRVQKLI